MTEVPPVYTSVLDAIGNTPLHEVTRIDAGPCRLFLKLEDRNPGGSIKDRIGRSMIEAAARDGSLKPGGTLIEATAGNTGLGLAVVAAQIGYRLVIVVPDKMAQEKIFHLRAMGAEVLVTRSDVHRGHPDYYMDKAEAMAAEHGYFYVNQFANPANPQAHVETTGPEIEAQCGSLGLKPDAIVCGVGSGGTITGLSRYFATHHPACEFVLADPEGSMLAGLVRDGVAPEDVGSWLVEGIGQDVAPEVLDLTRVKHAYSVSDAESFSAVRELLEKEGVLAGSSSGTLIAAALSYARAQTTPKCVVTFVCDSGNKYLSKVFNDFWMADNGFLELGIAGDLRDLVSRKHGEGQAVTVKPSTPLRQVYQQMKLYDYSQLPVLDGDTLVGLIDEEDLLVQVHGSGGEFKGIARDIMTRDIRTVDARETLEHLLDVLTRGMVAPILHNGRFEGLVTKIDVLNHMRLAAKA